MDAFVDFVRTTNRVIDREGREQQAETAVWGCCVHRQRHCMDNYSSRDNSEITSTCKGGLAALLQKKKTCGSGCV